MRKAASRLVAACTFAVLSSTLSSGAALDATGSIAHARRLIEANDHAAATAVLEDALIDAEAKDRPAIVQLLRQSYAAMAKRAEDAGQKREAAHYRDNLAILNRDQEPPARPKDSDEKPKKPDPPQATTPLEPGPELSATAPTVEPKPVPAKPVVAKPIPAKPTVQEADRLFVAGNYSEAGKVYAELARESRLPAKRKEHWGYCRYVALVDWIKQGPRSQREWDQILEELESIQRLTPSSWYGEYLRDKVAEVRRKGPRALPQSNDLVVRASAPDDAEPKRYPRLLGKLKGRTQPQPDAASQPARPVEQPLELPLAASALPPAALPPAGQNAAAASTNPLDNQAPNRPLEPLDVDVNRAGAPSSSGPDRPLEPLDVDANSGGAPSSSGPSSAWQIHETANFRIFHRDARLAASAAETAEAVRAAQGKQWGSQAAARRWTPACEIYLYPDGKALKAATQQPETSPGFSTMTSDGAQVVARRVNLRADHPQLLSAILPHEVTHVVLADIFTVKQIPRWADEGLAVMAEPRSEQQLRWAELRDPLKSGRLFPLKELMDMDYPEAKDWSLYYAQSVSLTRFLVEQDSPERFIRFVLDSHQQGAEAALQDFYQIKGFTDLQDRWTEYARKHVATATASAREGSDQPPTTTR